MECISDRVYNYLLMGKKKLGIPDIDEDDDMDMWKMIIEIYKNLRVDGYLGLRNPSLSASAIIYYCAVHSGSDYTQRVVANCFETSIGSVRKHFHRLNDYQQGQITIFGDKKI